MCGLGQKLGVALAIHTASLGRCEGTREPCLFPLREGWGGQCPEYLGGVRLLNGLSRIDVSAEQVSQALS